MKVDVGVPRSKWNFAGCVWELVVVSLVSF